MDKANPPKPAWRLNLGLFEVTATRFELIGLVLFVLLAIWGIVVDL